MTGTPTRPPTTLGSAPFHPGADNHDAGFRKRLAIGQQAMNARDADIVKMLDLVAHEFGGDDRLFGDRDVAGSGGDYGDHSFAIFCFVAVQDDGSPEFAVLDAANFLLHRGKLLFAGARGQNVAAVFGEPGENSSHLRRSLAFSKDDLGHAGAQGAVMIDLREAEVFERHVTQARHCIVGR